MHPAASHGNEGCKSPTRKGSAHHLCVADDHSGIWAKQEHMQKLVQVSGLHIPGSLHCRDFYSMAVEGMWSFVGGDQEQSFSVKQVLSCCVAALP